jgi:(R)-2-hydroxyacyl-CoA dehydratese activating ATPase
LIAMRLPLVEQAYAEALKLGNIKRSDVLRVWASGSSGKLVKFADHYIPDAVGSAHGVLLKCRTSRTVIDVGAEECQVFKMSQEGKILDYAVSERGAMGMGIFSDSMARAMNMTIAEMSESSLTSTRSIFTSGRYEIFGESRHVLINKEIPKNDLARAVYEAVATNVAAVAQTIGLADDVAVIGGMAKNKGFVEALKRVLGKDLQEPHNPQFVCAFGTAVAAAAEVVDEEIRTKHSKK